MAINPPGLKKFINTEDSARLDTAAAILSGETRSLVESLLEKGLIRLNGKPAKKSAKLKKGDVIEIDFQEEPIPDLSPQNIPFGIIIDKPEYALIDKPAGLTVHPAPGHFDNTLVNALLYAFSIKDEDNGFRPGIVHRIDKDTSGLLVIAKNAAMRMKLSKLFAGRLVEKKYTAVCQGTPKWIEKQVDEPIGRDKRDRKKMAVTADGRNALSRFKVIEVYKNAFLAEVSIFTGRTHQIRVHASHLKHPLVGDVLYGGKPVGDFSRQALHSSFISFIDPDTGETIAAHSEIPADMRELIEKLKGM